MSARGRYKISVAVPAQPIAFSGAHPETMEVLKKILVAVLVLGLLSFAWSRARRALRSPEEAVRARLEEMRDGFNSTTLRHVMSAFHGDYRDRSSGSTRREVADSLRYMFFQERDTLTKGFPYRMSIPSEELVVTVSETDPPQVEVTLRAVIEHSTRGEWELWWDARATLDFVKTDEGWKILESRRVNHAERKDRPRRARD